MAKETVTIRAHELLPTDTVFSGPFAYPIARIVMFKSKHASMHIYLDNEPITSRETLCVTNPHWNVRILPRSK